MDSPEGPFNRLGEFFKNLGNGLLDFGAILVVLVDDGYSYIDSLRIYCMRYGWCFTPDFPLHELLNSALDLKSAKNPQHTLYKRIRDFLLAEDAKEMRAILLAFRDSGALGYKRVKILNDCIHVLQFHAQERFNAANVVVPTLLSVIDGIISDFALEHLQIGNWHATKSKNAIKREFERVCFSFDRPGIDLLFEVLFSSAYPTTAPESGRRFNRHHIVHGNWLEFGRIEYVLRGFLLVFFTAYIVDEYAARKASGDDAPVTERSIYSKNLSTNVVAGMKDLAKARLASRGLDGQDPEMLS